MAHSLFRLQKCGEGALTHYVFLFSPVWYDSSELQVELEHAIRTKQLPLLLEAWSEGADFNALLRDTVSESLLSGTEALDRS